MHCFVSHQFTLSQFQNHLSLISSVIMELDPVNITVSPHNPGFCIHRFHQLWIGKKHCIVIDMYLVVRPRMVGSVLNIYRLFSCHDSLNYIV